MIPYFAKLLMTLRGSCRYSTVLSGRKPLTTQANTKKKQNFFLVKDISSIERKLCLRGGSDKKGE